MLSETFKKVGLLSLGISLALTSCSEDVEETSTATAEPTANLEVSQAIIQQVEDLGMNTNYVRWDDFYFPDGSSEPRLFLEEDVIITPEELSAMAANVEVSKSGKGDSKQYRNSALVSQGRTYSFAMGGRQLQSSKWRKYQF